MSSLVVLGISDYFVVVFCFFFTVNASTAILKIESMTVFLHSSDILPFSGYFIVALFDSKLWLALDKLVLLRLKDLNKANTSLGNKQIQQLISTCHVAERKWRKNNPPPIQP